MTKELQKRSEQAISFLSSRGVVFDAGLSDGEVATVQERFGFQFPPDLRAFLQTALPLKNGNPTREVFPNWRSGDWAKLDGRMAWPFDGIAFDIKSNAFWCSDWGPKPDQLDEALAVARQHVNAAPKLIPVFSHRYLPAEPCLSGNPVFSVYQTDIIYYGSNLWDYFRHEFSSGMEGDVCYEGVRSIRFWTDLIRANA